MNKNKLFLNFIQSFKESDSSLIESVTEAFNLIFENDESEIEEQKPKINRTNDFVIKFLDCNGQEHNGSEWSTNPDAYKQLRFIVGLAKELLEDKMKGTAKVPACGFRVYKITKNGKDKKVDLVFEQLPKK